MVKVELFSISTLFLQHSLSASVCTKISVDDLQNSGLHYFQDPDRNRLLGVLCSRIFMWKAPIDFSHEIIPLVFTFVSNFTITAPFISSHENVLLPLKTLLVRIND